MNSIDTVVDRPATAGRNEVIALAQHSLWIQGGLALILHSWFGPLVMGMTRVRLLPMSAYEQPVLTWELLTRPGRRVVVAAVCMLLFLLRRHATWETLSLGRHARLFVMGAAALLVWPFATVDYNFFFDQGYVADRLILIALWTLIYVHPFFTVPLLLVLSLLTGQLLYPLPEGLWHWPDKRLPLDFLVMFSAFLVLRPFFRQHRQAFILLTCTVVASQYFHAGLNKILLGPLPWTWLTENHLSHILVGGHVNGGWLRPLSISTIRQIANALSTVDPLLTSVTLFVECGMILLLLHRKLLPWLLSAAVGLHVGILFLTGIFFWKWIVFDLMLALWLAKSWRAEKESLNATRSDTSAWSASWQGWLLGRGLFSASGFAVFVFLVLVSKPFFRNVSFAWWDTPYINFFEIRGVGQSGAEYVLDSRFFSPYDMLIHQARFPYLKKSAPMIGGTYAVSHDYQFARAVETAAPNDLEVIRRTFGVPADPEFAHESTQAFELFVVRYVENANRRGRKQWWLNWFAPPYHFQTWRPVNAYDLQEPLQQVYVLHREFLDWQGELVDVGNERVLDVTLR